MELQAEGLTTAQLVVELKLLLDDFTASLERADLRTRVRRLVPAFLKLRVIGASLLPASGHEAARHRIILYLRRYPGQVIRGDELLVISGIGEWARRVRELRVQFGWPIVTGSTLQAMIEQEEFDGADYSAENLGVDDYILLADEQDKEGAYRWSVANSIRRSPKSVQDKILDYLLVNVGKPVTGEELRYVASSKTEWARRVRELRTEQGWTVVTKNTGRPDLDIGVYLLEHERQLAPHDRRIPDLERRKALTRDQFKCQMCGWDRSRWQPADARNLELHHSVPHAMGGVNTADNLETLCNVCHDGRHASGHQRD